jgi:hypothetical protein
MAAAELLRDFKHNPYLGSLHRSGMLTTANDS